MGGEGGAPATCVFRRLAKVGQGLDGELAQLVPQAGLTSAQTDAVIPPGTPLPSRSHWPKPELRRHTTLPSIRSRPHLPDNEPPDYAEVHFSVHLFCVICLIQRNLTIHGCTFLCTRE